MKQFFNNPCINKRTFYKRFGTVLLIMLIILGGLQGIFYYSQTREMIKEAKSEETKKVNLQKEKITSTFEFISNDLLSIANTNSVHNFLNARTQRSDKKSQRDIARFLRYKGFYDQAKIIDLQGKEILRINYQNNRPILTLQDSLQSKRHRYYFPDAVKLDKDEIYISPFDLNLERKQVEVPLKPTIRFCTPVFTRDDIKVGIFVLNFMGDRLTKDLLDDSGHSPGQTVLVNSDGFYTLHPEKEKEWGFMFEKRKIHSLANDWPESSDSIHNNLDGQLFEGKSWLTFTTIFPSCINDADSSSVHIATSGDHVCTEDYWKIISILPHSQLKASYKSINKLHLVISIIILVMSTLIAYILARTYSFKQASINRLTLSEQSLRKANLTKDKFISILAHDLKNPIASIMGFTEFILQTYSSLSESEKKEYLSIINKASANLTELIDDILTWARSQSGRINWEPHNFNIKDTLWNAIDTIDAQASQKGIDIVVKGKNDIEVFADSKMIKTVFRNLISNAIKFSNRDSEIHVILEKDTTDTTIHIQDSGIGIPESEQEKLFQLGRKVQTNGTENETGTGLGLILCKEFVKQNKGKIWVKSKEGKGTTFSFTLPNKRG